MDADPRSPTESTVAPATPTSHDFGGLEHIGRCYFARCSCGWSSRARTLKFRAWASYATHRIAVRSRRT